jgi:hypothetical protein
LLGESAQLDELDPFHERTELAPYMPLRKYGRAPVSWFDQFRRKLTTAEGALEAVRSGDRVYIQEGCATPGPLIAALVKRSFELRRVEIVHMLTLGCADYVRPECEGHFRHNGLFLGENVRDAVAAGRADYTPIFLGEIEDLFSSGTMPLDVALVQTSPPDEHGYLGLGVGVDCTLTAARCARHTGDQRSDLRTAERHIPPTEHLGLRRSLLGDTCLACFAQVVPRVLDQQPATRLHQPLLQTGQRPVVDRLRQHQPPPQVPQVVALSRQRVRWGLGAD